MTLSAGFLLFAPRLARAVSTGLEATGSAAGLSEGPGLSEKVGLVIGALLGLIGVIFLIIIIYAGLLWMTAMGDSAKITKARQMIINSILGLIVVFGAYAITNYVLNAVLGMEGQ